MGEGKVNATAQGGVQRLHYAGRKAEHVINSVFAFLLFTTLGMIARRATLEAIIWNII